MDKLTLDPSQPIQLGEGLLALWLPRGRDRDARARGLLSSFTLCLNPDCPCTTVHLLVHEIDDRAVRVVRLARSLKITWRGVTEAAPSPKGMAALELDLVTGVVAASGGHALPAFVAPFFEEPLPYWVLDDLFASWAAARPGVDWRAHALGPWEPGVLLTTMMAFPDQRPDRYRIGQALYQVDLHFAVGPEVEGARREGADAVFSVFEILEGGRNAVEVATASLSSQTMTPVPLQGGGDLEVLAQVYLAWRRRQVSPAARLLELRARTRERGRELLALAEAKARERARLALARLPPRPASPSRGRVPRNAPCPCGSGLKYKKCCGRS